MGDNALKPSKINWHFRFKKAGEEQRFVSHYVEYYHRFAQASLILALFLLLGDFLVDYILQPEVHSNWLRLSICFPTILFGLAYSFTSTGKAQWQKFMSILLVSVALELFGILILIDRDGGNGLNSWVGILNFTFLEFFCFVILGIQFWYALIAGSFVLVAFECALILGLSWSLAQLAYWSFHIATVFILTSAIGWWREHLLRKEYLIKNSLESARNQLALHSDRLEEEINLDFLTRAYNRRYFMEASKRELARADRHHLPLTLAFIDLDNFKKLYDTQGHERGDELLTLVVRTLQTNLRENDILARMGGDEFVLLFPQTDQAQARQLIDRLVGILKAAIEPFNSNVSCSVGVVTKPPGNNLSVDGLLSAADQVMYRVKQSSKDAIEYALITFPQVPHDVLPSDFQ